MEHQHFLEKAKLLIGFIEDSGIIGVDKNDKLIRLTPETDLSSVDRIVNIPTVENLSLQALFGTDKFNTEQYSIMLKLFKMVHIRTSNAVKSRVQDRFKAHIHFVKGGDDSLE